jgi:DNA polymerase-3 subunit gamma/tau
MSQALSRKWRPARFDDVVGQEHVTQTLQNALVGDRVSHAYLFCGPRGTGKTTTARLVAKAVNCLHDEIAQRPDDQCRVCLAINEGRYLDLIEIDAASNTGVDDIRDLRDKINFAPNEGRFKVYIIDEVHMLSTAAFNALLKTLEEPPAHVIFVLATTEEHKVPITIKSRCQQFNFRLLSTAEIIGRLQFLAEQEHLTIEPEAMALIASEGAGSLRDAESLLDQLVTAPGATITLERAQRVLGTASSQSVRELADAWIAGDAAQGLTIIHSALASGADARQFSRQMVNYLRQLLLLQTAGTQIGFAVSAEQQAIMQTQAEQARRKTLIDTIKAFNLAATQPGSNWQPQLPLELAYIESLPDQHVPIRAQPVAPVTIAVTPEPVVEKVVEAVVEEVVVSAEKPPIEATPEPVKKEATPKQVATPAALQLATITATWPDAIESVRQYSYYWLRISRFARQIR